jgi:hypothetical protein
MCELMWSSWNGRFDLLSLLNLVLVNIELDILTKNRSGGDQVNVSRFGLTSCITRADVLWCFQFCKILAIVEDLLFSMCLDFWITE